MDDPEILIEIGGLVDETGVCLALYGSDLDPDDVTARLRCQPTSGHERGDRTGPYSQVRGPKTWDSGAWLLEERGLAPTGPEQFLRRLLMRVPTDAALWTSLRSEGCAHP